MDGCAGGRERGRERGRVRIQGRESCDSDLRSCDLQNALVAFMQLLKKVILLPDMEECMRVHFSALLYRERRRRGRERGKK